MTSEVTGSPDVDAPTRRARGVLARARAVLLDEASAARDLRPVADAVLDLASAHPSGIAHLLASGRQQLSGLVRDGDARAAALLRLRRYREIVGELADRGMAGGYLVAGVVALSGAELPVLLRGCRVTGSGTGDASITVHGPVTLNPALVREVSRRSAGQVDLLTELAPRLRAAGERPGLDPEPLLDVVQAALQPLPGAVLRRRLVVAPVSVDSERLVADLEELRSRTEAHPVLAWVGEDWAEEPGGDAAVPGTAGPVAAPEPVAVEPATVAERRPLDAASAAVIDRFVPEALDEDQRRVVAAVLSGHSLAVDAPAGTGATTVVMAVAVVAAVTGRRSLVVLPTRTEADLLLDRFAAHGLGSLVGVGDAPPTGGQAVDEQASDRQREEAAARYRSLLDDLVRRRSPWAVSRYQALDALAAAETAGGRLTQVALDQTGRRGIDRDRLEQLVVELEEAVSLGLLDEPRSAWSGAAISAATEAVAALSLARRLRDDLVREARAAADQLAAGTGTAPARTLADVRQRYLLFSGLQRTLDKLSPEVFDVPILDLVAATGDSGFRSAAQYDIPMHTRWKLQRRARRLVRPGVDVRAAELHELLSGAASQRMEWQSIAGGAGWAHLPSATPALVSALGALVEACDRLAAMHPGLALEHADLDEVQRTAAALVDDEWALGDLPRRTLLQLRLDEAGATPLVEALTALSAPGPDGSRAAAPVSPEAAGRELRLAWWLGVAGATATEGALDATLQAAAQLRAAELGHRSRAAQRVHAARAKLAPADREGPAVRVLLPAQVAALGPDEQADVLLLDDAGRLAFVEACGALARSTQVVAVGELGSARPASALGVLAPALAAERLDVGHRHNDPLLSALARAAGSRPVVGVPGPHPARSVRLTHLPGVTGLPQGDSDVVETTEAEVDHVVREALRLAVELDAAQPPRSLAVVALTRSHAAAVAAGIRRALKAYPALAEAFSDDRAEPVVVASAEQCRGLERDVVLLTVGFTRTPHGRVLHRFGPLDAAAGAGLVATAVTRARQEVRLVTGLRAEDLDPERLRTPGARALARVLAVAERAERSGDGPAEPAGAGDVEAVPASLVVLGSALADLGAVLRPVTPVPGCLALDTALGPAVVDLDAEHPDPETLLRRATDLERAGWRHVLVAVEGVADDHLALARRLVVGPDGPDDDVARGTAGEPDLPDDAGAAGTSEVPGDVRAGGAAGHPDEAAAPGDVGAAEEAGAADEAAAADDARRAVVDPPSPGGGDPVLPGRAADDSDRGWGEHDGDDGDDDRILRERPPHW